MVTLAAKFTMKKGAERRALALVAGVKRYAKRREKGTLVYIVHRVPDAKTKRPGRTLYFYECYRNHAALTAHITSPAWNALTAAWKECFEGSPKKIKVVFLDRVGGFARRGAKLG